MHHVAQYDACSYQPCNFNRGLFFSFSCIFRSATVLAFLAHPGHVVIYAPRDLLRRRLVANRTILEKWCYT
ncbi:hypothetical protein CQA31_14920 [Citrobacter freundii]|nr:hypothetical protein CQA31_14920 [Citrobacter freundii]